MQNPQPMKQRAVVVLPTYNEQATIKDILLKILAQASQAPAWDIHVLVVDSTSPDGTGSIVEELIKKDKRIHLLLTAKEGLGKAYQRGFAYAIERLKADVLFEMDADFSHNPADIPRFLRTIEEGADFVLGSRYIKGGSIPSNWAFHRKLFSVLGNIIIRLGFMKLRITDWTTGYRAMRAEVAVECSKNIQLYSNYVFQVAFLDNAIKKGFAVKEIPIQFVDRMAGSSKINSGQYIKDVLLYVFQHSSFIKFAIVGAIGFIIDFSVTKLLKDHILGDEPLRIALASAIGAEAAVINNFLLNNYWSFSYKKLKHSVPTFVKAFIKFNIAAVISIFIQFAGMYTLTFIFGATYWYIFKALVIIGLVIPYSYYVYNRIIWKPKKRVRSM